MDRVRQSAPQLARITPYDPKYIPAEAYMSANENPHDVDEDVRRAIERRIKNVELNRYPDPLANELRDAIAEANGLDRDWVLIGNGGDGLLFDTALAWGGPGRTFLNMPPTFSVYEANARLLNTTVLEVPRDRENEYAIDEERVLELMSGPTSEVDFTIISNPNNPTGLMTSFEFLEKLLASTDALVMVDEAYFEFSRQTMRPHLEAHKNLVILRTFSKAFSLAGVRLGYILGHPEVIDEYKKVRQPYSVDAVSQAIGSVVYEHRSTFVPAIDACMKRFGSYQVSYPIRASRIGCSSRWQMLGKRGKLSMKQVSLFVISRLLLGLKVRCVFPLERKSRMIAFFSVCEISPSGNKKTRGGHAWKREEAISHARPKRLISCSRFASMAKGELR